MCPNRTVERYGIEHVVTRRGMIGVIYQGPLHAEGDHRIKLLVNAGVLATAA